MVGDVDVILVGQWTGHVYAEISPHRDPGPTLGESPASDPETRTRSRAGTGETEQEE